MTFNQDGVDVYCLPDNAYCEIDDEKRNPLDFDECPIENEECGGDCLYYREGEK